MRSILKQGRFNLATVWSRLILLLRSAMRRSTTASTAFACRKMIWRFRETDFKSQTSTVLMIDISHSMILYGEDRITPAKKVAMALSELIKTRYPKDTLDIVVFGNDAWTIEVKDLPYLQVGPYHTNTVAGLELAMEILRRRRNPNKQIFMITDGKPTCLKVGRQYYKNSFRYRQEDHDKMHEPCHAMQEAEDPDHYLYDSKRSLPPKICRRIYRDKQW
jgi:uncharacterized protein with von Willebrand factor type A (vWA) domain